MKKPIDGGSIPPGLIFYTFYLKYFKQSLVSSWCPRCSFHELMSVPAGSLHFSGKLLYLLLVWVFVESGREVVFFPLKISIPKVLTKNNNKIITTAIIFPLICMVSLFSSILLFNSHEKSLIPRCIAKTLPFKAELASWASKNLKQTSAFKPR